MNWTEIRRRVAAEVACMEMLEGRRPLTAVPEDEPTAISTTTAA